MKNLRMAKKNPSKILKIIQVPLTHRYTSHHQNAIISPHIHQIILSSSKDKDQKLINISTHRQRIVPSPSHSQRIIEFSSLEKAKRAKNRSLNRSHEMIKSEEKDSIRLVVKQSIDVKPKNQYSPYIKRTKYKESQKFLNFKSVNLNQKNKREDRDSRQISKNSSLKKNVLLRIEGHSQNQLEKRAENDAIESAKRLLNNGEYRKSLLVVKPILKNKPEHIEALYLSALNWYHLEDKPKTHYFTQQIIQHNPTYSPQCYKIKAVCFFKTLQYAKSLTNLKLCHDLFPNESQSYEIQGKIYIKMKKWNEAIHSYLKAYQFTKNVEFLGIIGSCYEEVNELTNALQFYQEGIKSKWSLKTFLKRMRLQVRSQQFEKVLEGMSQIEKEDFLLQRSKERDEIYYLCSYSSYKLKKYSNALILIDEGVRCCEHQSFSAKFSKLLLTIKIIERDFYQAHHLIQRLQDDGELGVLRRFVEGVINLMRRNYNEGIIILLSIQQDIGFKLQISSRCSSISEVESKAIHLQVCDQFLNELKKIYLLFLSYGYISISEFHSAYKFIQMQKELEVPAYFQLGLSYNRQMCLGIIHHCDRRYRQAQTHFIKAKAIYENKLEPPFSLAINYLQIMITSQTEVDKLEMIQQAKGQFDICKRILGKSLSNTAASLYYFNCLLHGYLEEWKEALILIDQSIERSQDHYWRYFYLKGMLLACIHSFKEAINHLTIAINLSGNTKPECYLLRSKCLQIEGDGNEAFKDLQEYISLKPDDPQVHKYAGQLLFENGAFEDSLTALTHQIMPQTPQNYDLFLTEGKSLFLLGRFSQGKASFLKAHSIQPTPQVLFDIKVIQCLETLTIKNDHSLAKKTLEQIFGNFEFVGRIFKIPDFYVLKATCLVLEQKYDDAIELFRKSITQKANEMVDEQDELTLLENKKELQNFSKQITYNIILCYLNLKDNLKAIEEVNQMEIDIDQAYYIDFLNFKKFVSGQTQIFKKQQVFPSKNKLSNFLQKITVNKTNQNGTSTSVQLKFCIPFPKVEPPQIFPTFDQNLLIRLSVLNVQRKPEAPWIVRQYNSIKFTDKIETFSRLQLEDSESQSSSTYNIISVDNSHLERHSNRSRRAHTNSNQMGNSKTKLLKLIQ